MSEFSEYADRIRSSLDNETAIVNNRMNWLLLLQGFLFAGFTQTLEQHDHEAFSVLIACAGILTACIMRYSFWRSEKAIQLILLYWDTFLDGNGKNFLEFPPVWAGAAADYLELVGKLSKKEIFLQKRLGFLVEHRSLPIILLLAWIISLVFCFCV